MSTATLSPTLELNFESADPTNYFIEAINNLAKAQMACNRKLEQHITKNNEFQKEVNSELKTINKKLKNQQNQITRNSVHIAYIKNIIKEAAKHYGIPQKDIEHENIVSYRKSFKNSYDMKWENIWNRIQRIRYLCGIESTNAEFEREVCGRLGMTRDQIRMEPQAIAMHFNDGCSKMSFNNSLELNKEYMEVAKDVIFSLEKKYGINDTDKKSSVKLHCELCLSRDSIAELNNKEYVIWVEDMIEKYKNLLIKPADTDMVINMVFDYFKRHYNKRFYCNNKYSNLYNFCGNFSTDMYEILRDEKLKEWFARTITYNFIGMWNVPYKVYDDYRNRYRMPVSK